MKLLAREGIQTNRHRIADLDAPDVNLRDIGLNFKPRFAHEGQHWRVRGYDLADLEVRLGHEPGDRRSDHGFCELGLGPPECGLRRCQGSACGGNFFGRGSGPRELKFAFPDGEICVPGRDRA